MVLKADLSIKLIRDTMYFFSYYMMVIRERVMELQMMKIYKDGWLRKNSQPEL